MHEATTHRLSCPNCGGLLECYKTFPTRTRVRRLKRCTGCGAMHETIETFKNTLSNPLPVTGLIYATIEHDQSSPNMTSTPHIEPRGEQVK